MRFPGDKLSVVIGVKAGRFSRAVAASRAGVSEEELQAWERAYDISKAKGWSSIPGQPLEKAR